jgi:ABC-type multidrug transport system ATPase subunit
VQFFSLFAMLTIFPYPFELPVWLMYLPQMSFARVYYYISKKCLEGKCYMSFSEVQGEFRTVMLTFTFSGFLYIFIAIVVNYIVSEQGGSFSLITLLTNLFSGVKSMTRSGKPGGLNKTRGDLANGSHNSIKPDKQSDKEDELFLNGSSSHEIELGSLSADEIQVHNDGIEQASFPPVLCKGVCKTYYRDGKPFQALEPTTIEIKKGQVLGLLGPNGAGKTTLISILTGLIKPDAGDAWIGGYHIVNQRPNVYKNIGVCPQFDLFWEDLTIQEHLLFYLRLKGFEGDDEMAKVEEACREVELQDHMLKLAKELSGGMKRRLSLAVALVGQPSAVFLDEPTTGLDPLNRETFWEVLEKVKKGKSIILTTHLMQEADFLSDKIGILLSYAAIIHKGRIQCNGTPSEIKRSFGSGIILHVIFEDFHDDHRESDCSQSIFELSRLLKSLKDDGHLNSYALTNEKRSSAIAKFSVDQNLPSWTLRTRTSSLYLRL